MDIPLPGEILPQSPVKHAAFYPPVPLIPPPAVAPPLPSVPLYEDIPMPAETPAITETPTEDANRYSPSGAMFEEDQSTIQNAKFLGRQLNRFSVLGKIKAKKRLLAFSATKQAGGAGLTFNLPKKIIVKTKAAKEFIPSVGPSEEDKPTEAMAKKKLTTSKKGATREDKARAVVTAIEEIKREELLMRGAFRLAIENKSPGKMTAPIPLQGLPVDLSQLSRDDSKQKLDGDVGNSEKDGRRSDGKKEERRSHRKSERRSKERQRDRKDRSKERSKERSKPKKEPFKLPMNWSAVRASGLKLEDIRRRKLELESKSGSRSRSKEDKQKDPLEFERELCNPLDYPTQARMPLRVTGVRQREKEFSWILVQYTTSKPTIMYSVCPTAPSAGIKTRAQILAHAKPEALKIMNTILEVSVEDQSLPDSESVAEDTQEPKSREWYPKVDKPISKSADELNRSLVPLPEDTSLEQEGLCTDDVTSVTDGKGEVASDFNNKTISQGSLVVPLTADQIRVPSKWDSDYEEDISASLPTETEDKECLQSPMDDGKAVKDEESYDRSLDNLPMDVDVNESQEEEEVGEAELENLAFDEEKNTTDLATSLPIHQSCPASNTDLKLVSEYEEFMKAVSDKPCEQETEGDDNLLDHQPKERELSPTSRKTDEEDESCSSDRQHQLSDNSPPTKKRKRDKVIKSQDKKTVTAQIDTQILTPNKVKSESPEHTHKTSKKKRKKKVSGKKGRKSIIKSKKKQKKRKKKKARHKSSSSSSSSDEVTDIEEKEIPSKPAKKKKKKRRKKKDTSSSSSEELTDVEQKEESTKEAKKKRKKKKKNVSSSSSEEITEAEEKEVEPPKLVKKPKKKQKKNVSTSSSEEDWTDAEKEDVESPKQSKKKKKKKVHVKKKKLRKKAKRVETSSSDESSSSESSSDSSSDESSSSDDHRRSNRKRKKPPKKRRRKDTEEPKKARKEELDHDVDSEEPLNDTGMPDSLKTGEFVGSQIEGEDRSSGESCWEERAISNKAHTLDTIPEEINCADILRNVCVFQPEVGENVDESVVEEKQSIEDECSTSLKRPHNYVVGSVESSLISKLHSITIGKSDNESSLLENKCSGSSGLKDGMIIRKKFESIHGEKTLQPTPQIESKLRMISSPAKWEGGNDKWSGLSQKGDAITLPKPVANNISNSEKTPIVQVPPTTLPIAKRKPIFMKSSSLDEWERDNEKWLDQQQEKLESNFSKAVPSGNLKNNDSNSLNLQGFNKEQYTDHVLKADSKALTYLDPSEAVSSANHTSMELSPNKLPIPSDVDVSRLSAAAVASNGMMTSFFEDVSKEEMPHDKVPEMGEKKFESRSLFSDLYSPGQEDDKSTTSEEMPHNKLDGDLPKESPNQNASKQCTVPTLEPLVGCQIPTIVSEGTKVARMTESLLLLDNIPLPPSQINVEKATTRENILLPKELTKRIILPKKLLGKVGKELGDTTRPASEHVPSLGMGGKVARHLITVKLLTPSLSLQVSKGAKGTEINSTLPFPSLGAKLTEAVAPIDTKDQIARDEALQAETGTPIDMFGEAKLILDGKVKPRVRKRFSRWGEPVNPSADIPSTGGWTELNKPSVEASSVGGWTQLSEPSVETADVGGWTQLSDPSVETASAGGWTELNNPSVEPISVGGWTQLSDPTVKTTSVGEWTCSNDSPVKTASVGGWSQLADPSSGPVDVLGTNNNVTGDLNIHSGLQTSRSDIPFAKDIDLFTSTPLNDLENCGDSQTDTLPSFQAVEQHLVLGGKCHVKVEEDSKSDHTNEKTDTKKRESRSRDDSRGRDRDRDDSRGRDDSRSRESDSRSSRDRGRSDRDRSDRDPRRDRDRDRWDSRRKDDRRRNSSREEGSRSSFRDKRQRSPARDEKSRSPDKYRSTFKEERQRTPIRDERRRSSDRSIRRLSGDRRKSPVRESRSPVADERRRSIDRADRRRSPRKEEKRWRSIDSNQDDRRHSEGDRRTGLRDNSPSDNGHLGTIPLPVAQVGSKPHSEELTLHLPSLPDSTVIDSELVPANSLHPTPAGKQLDKNLAVRRHTTVLASPPSPKRLSLDERLALELGVEMTPPLPVPCPQIPGEIYPRYDSYPPGFQPYSTLDATKPGLLPTPSPDKYLGPPVINQFGIPVLQDNQIVARPTNYPNQVQPPQNFQPIAYTPDVKPFENAFVPPENFSRPPPVIGNFIAENYPVQTEHLQTLVSLHSGYASRLSAIGTSAGSNQQVQVLSCASLIELDTQSIGTPPTVYPPVYPIPYTAQAPTLPETPRLPKKSLPEAPTLPIMTPLQKEKFERRKKKEVHRREKEQERWSEIKNNAKYKAALQQEGEVLRRNSGLNLEEIRLVTADTAIKSVNISTTPRSISDKVVPLPQAGRGILISAGFRDEPVEIGVKKAPKTVRFADDVLPGEGTSPSAGEELPSSPPYDPGARKKEKKLHKKKQKIKVQVIRKTASEKKVRTLPPPPLPPPPPPDYEPPASLKLLVWQAPPQGYMWRKTLKRIKISRTVEETSIVPAVPEQLSTVNHAPVVTSQPPTEMPQDLSSPQATQFAEPPNQLAALLPTLGVTTPRRSHHSLIHVLGHKHIQEQLKALVPRQGLFNAPLEYRVDKAQVNVSTPPLPPPYSQYNLSSLQRPQMIAIPLKFPLSQIKQSAIQQNQAQSNVIEQGNKIPVVANTFFNPPPIGTPPPKPFIHPPPQHHGIPVIGGGPPSSSSPYQSPNHSGVSESHCLVQVHLPGAVPPPTLLPSSPMRVVYDTTRIMEEGLTFVGDNAPYGAPGTSDEHRLAYGSPQPLEDRQPVLVSYSPLPVEDTNDLTYIPANGSQGDGAQFGIPLPSYGSPITAGEIAMPFVTNTLLTNNMLYNVHCLEESASYGSPYDQGGPQAYNNTVGTEESVPFDARTVGSMSFRAPQPLTRLVNPPMIFNIAQNFDHRTRVPRNRPKHRQYRQ